MFWNGPKESRKRHLCYGCGQVGRGVNWVPLAFAFYHYECWIETGMSDPKELLADDVAGVEQTIPQADGDQRELGL